METISGKSIENKSYRYLYQQFQGVLDAIPDAICLISPELKIVWANETEARIQSVRSSDMIGQYCYTLRHGRTTPCENCPVVRCFHSGKIETGEDEAYGERFELRAVPLYDDTGKLHGAVEVARNISDAKRMETRLRESEERFRGITNNLPGHIYQFYARDNGEMGLYYVSERSEELLGLDNNPEDYFERFLACIAPEDKERFLASIQTAVRSVSRWEFEGRFIKPTGGKMYVRGLSHPRRLEGETVFDGILLDVTDRKKTEEALKEKEKRLSEAQELAQLGHWIWDVRTGNVKWSKEVYKIFRLDPNEFTPHIDLIQALSPWPGDHKRDEELIRKAMASHERGTYDQRFLRPDGSTGYYHSTFQGKYDAEGNLVSIMGTVLDITDRKQTEETLRNAEERYRSIYDHAVEGIYQVTPEGRFLTANAALAGITGYDSPEELVSVIQNTAEQLWVYPERRVEYFKQIREHGIVQGFEAQFFRKDKSRIWVSLSARVVHGSDGQVLYTEGTLEDITERKRAEQNLQREMECRYFLLDLYKKSSEMTDQDLYRYIINEAVRLTGSAVGFFHFVSDDQENIILTAWNDEAFKDCKASYAVHYPIDEAGNWVDCVRLKRPVVYNDFPDSPGQKGLPNGHLKLHRFLSVPVWDEGKVRIIFGVGNKVEAYDEANVSHLQLVANELHKIIKQRHAEKALRENEAKYRAVIENMQDVFYRTDVEGNIIMVSPSAVCLLGIGSIQEIYNRNVNDFYGDPEDREKLMQDLKTHGMVNDYELKLKRPDGGIVFTSASSHFYRDVDGKPLGVEGVIRNITERKRMEDALRESEKRFFKVFRYSPVAIAISELESGKLIDVNPAWQKMTGYTRKEAIGRTTIELDCWPDPSARNKLFSILQEQGTVQGYEISVRRKSGEIGHGLMSAEAVVMGDKKCMLTMALDITDRKHAEELYRVLSERSFAGTYVIQDRVFKFINSRAASYAGYTPEQMTGTKAPQIIHPDDRDTVKRCSAEMLAKGRTVPYEFRIVTREGNLRWIMETVAPIYYEGKPAILGNSMDITEIKESQRQLEELKALEVSVMSAIPHGILGLRNRRIVFANAGVENIYGWKPEELIGQSSRILFKSDESFEEVGRLYLQLEKCKTVTAEIDSYRSRDRRDLVCRVVLSRIGDSLADDYVVAEIEDITEERRTKLQLMQSEKMASIGQLAAGVAHEINNPTGYVSSNLRTMGEYFNDMAAVLAEYQSLLSTIKNGTKGEDFKKSITERISSIESLERKVNVDFILNDAPNLIKESSEGTERIKSIVSDLKNFAHPGKEEFTDTNINKNIESTLNVVWNEIKYKATIDKDYGELPLIKCIPQQLNQVFMNILVNAAQAIKDRGKIMIRTKLIDGHVEVQISDTGVGIPPDHLSKIFDPFFTTKEVGKGTGLGLNVAYNIIKKHHGNIDVESKVGKGTTFTINLPVNKPDAEERSIGSDGE